MKMRKLLLLITALLTLGVSGAWAQYSVTVGNQVTSASGLIDGHLYLIRAQDGFYTTYISDNGTNYTAPASNVTPTTKHAFYFHSGGDGTWKIQNVYSGKYWGALADNNTTTGSNFAPAVEASAGSYSFTFNGSNVTAKDANYWINRSGGIMHGWSSGLTLYIYEVAAMALPEDLSSYGISEVSAPITTISSLSDDEYYVMQMSSFNNYIAYSDGANIAIPNSSGTLLENVASAASNSKFMFRLKSVGNSKYEIIRSDGKFMKAPTEAGNAIFTSFEGEAAQITFTQSGSCVKMSTGSTLYLDRSSQKFYWFGTNNNRSVYFHKVSLVENPVDITWQIVDGSDNVLASLAGKAQDGATLTASDIPVLLKRAYCTYELKGSTTVTSGGTIKATYTFSGAPFTFATSVEDATTNNKWKEIKRQDNSHYVYYNGETLAYDATDLSTADGYQWALIGHPYGYKLYNKGAEGYLSASIPTSNTATEDDFVFNSTGVTFELYKYSGKSGDNDHFVSVVQGTNTNEISGTVMNEAGGTWKLWCGLNNTAGFICNNGLMTGLSTSYLLPKDVPTTFSVKYNVNNYAGTQVATADIEVAAGDTGDDADNHLPSALRKDGCTYTYSPTTVSESNNVITVTYTYAPGYGFDVYNDYASISEWRFLKLNDANYIVYNSENSPNVQRTTTLSDVNNASWAFVGNPYEGIKIYNKGAGNTVWLTSSTPDVNDGTTGGGGYTSVTLASSGDKQVWYLSTSTYFTNGFFLGNNDGYKLNGRAGSTNVSYWMGGADGGSTFVAIGNVSEQFATLKNATKFDILEGSTVVGPSEFAAPAEINAAIDAAQNVDDNDAAKLTFIDSDNGKKIQNYLDQVATYGALANIKITMSKEYGTMILPCPATRISGLDIYSCSAQVNGVLTLTPVDGNYSYNVPYIIHAAEGSKYTIIGWDKGGTGTYTSDWLTGVLNSDTDIPSGSYMLATKKDTGVQAFYQVEGAGVKCAINKCYLTVPLGGNVKAFYFDEDGKTTSIEEIFGGETEHGAIYNLAGQRLQKLQKGINIINGKKIIK